MAAHYLRPNADGDKAEWTEVPAGAAYQRLDETVLKPAVPTTSDYVATNATNQSERLRFETFTPSRAITSASAHAYVKPGATVSVRADLVSGGTTLKQGAPISSTGGSMHFGTNEDYNWYYARDGHVAGAPVVASMGGDCARWPVFWFNHQFTSGGAYNWQGGTYTSAPYNAILAAGLIPVVVVCGAPDFAGAASGYGGLRIPDGAHIDDFAAFMAALQAHLPQAWLQVWNEPNYGLFGNGAGPGHLADMTDAASEAIQPKQIIAAATSPGGEQEASAYFNTMWDNISTANKPFVDAAAHVYPGPTGWQQDITNWLTRLNQRSPQRGWITECGIHRDQHGGNINQDARSRTMYEMARTAGIRGIIYHRFKTGDGVWEASGDFGIVNNAMAGANFVTNSLYTALKAERAEDPPSAGSGTYRWTETKYTGALTGAQIDGLEVHLISGGTAGGANAECAAVYLQVEELAATPGTPVKPTAVVLGLPPASINRSHQLATRVEVLSGGQQVATLKTVTGGSVTYDASAASRATCDVTLVDDGNYGYIPTGPNSLLAPFGNELRISRGIEYPPDVKLIQLGIFQIERVSTNDTGQGVSITVSGPDRSGRFVDAPFEIPWQTPAGTQADAEILRVLTKVYAGLSYNFPDVEAPLPFLGAEEGEDRWAYATGIATVIGGELFFDEEGTLILRRVPEVVGPAVQRFSEGEDGILLGVNRDWDRAQTFNKVIVTGNNPNVDGPTPRGEAADTDPSSPTFYSPTSKFGQKPYFYANQYVENDTQAGDAARGLLNRVIGAPDMINFQSIVDPARRPGEIIEINRPLSLAGANERHVLDSVTIPLSATEEMTAATRVAQVLLPG